MTVPELLVITRCLENVSFYPNQKTHLMNLRDHVQPPYVSTGNMLPNVVSAGESALAFSSHVMAFQSMIPAFALVSRSLVLSNIAPLTPYAVNTPPCVGLGSDRTLVSLPERDNRYDILVVFSVIVGGCILDM